MKHEVNERLAAYRNRRGAAEQSQPQMSEGTQVASTTAEEIKARVKARYARAASYSEELASSSTAVERVIGAVTKAAVEAVIAEMGPAAVTPTLWDAPLTPSAYAAPAAAVPTYVAPAAPVTPSRWQDEPEVAAAAPVMPSRWEDAVPPAAAVVEAEDDVWESMRVAPSPYANARQVAAPPRPSSEGELFPYDPMDPGTVEDPMRESLVEPAQAIQANIIEFPKPLVAAKKLRGRLADGPYRRYEDESQLSIFEVSPEEVASAIPEPAMTAAWASIELEARPEHEEPEGYSQAPTVAGPIYTDAVAYQPPVMERSVPRVAVYDETLVAETAEELSYTEGWAAAPIAEPESPTAAATSWE